MYRDPLTGPITSTSWFQDSLLLIFMPRCFAVLCSRSPGLVALCQCLAFSYFNLGLYSMAVDNI